MKIRIVLMVRDGARGVSSTLEERATHDDSMHGSRVRLRNSKNIGHLPIQKGISHADQGKLHSATRSSR